jgi:hypothetical protein
LAGDAGGRQCAFIVKVQVAGAGDSFPGANLSRSSANTYMWMAKWDWAQFLLLVFLFVTSFRCWLSTLSLYTLWNRVIEPLISLFFYPLAYDIQSRCDICFVREQNGYRDLHMERRQENSDLRLRVSSDKEQNPAQSQP